MYGVGHPARQNRIQECAHVSDVTCGSDLAFVITHHGSAPLEREVSQLRIVVNTGRCNAVLRRESNRVPNDVVQHEASNAVDKTHDSLGDKPHIQLVTVPTPSQQRQGTSPETRHTVQEYARHATQNCQCAKFTSTPIPRTRRSVCAITKPCSHPDWSPRRISGALLLVKHSVYRSVPNAP